MAVIQGLPRLPVKPTWSAEPPWYVIRLPGGVGGGEVVRPLPIPIMDENYIHDQIQRRYGPMRLSTRLLML